MAQNEMRAMRGMPSRVRSMEGLGVIADYSLGAEPRLECQNARMTTLPGWT